MLPPRRAFPPRLATQLPLRPLLILGFVLPLIGVVGAVEYLGWQREQRAIAQLVVQLQQRLGNHIQANLENFTLEPLKASQSLILALERGDLDPDRLEDWGPYLADQSQLFGRLTYLYFGNRAGDYVELMRRPGGVDQIILREHQRPERSVFLGAIAPTSASGPWRKSAMIRDRALGIKRQWRGQQRAHGLESINLSAPTSLRCRGAAEAWGLCIPITAPIRLAPIRLTQPARRCWGWRGQTLTSPTSTASSRN